MSTYGRVPTLADSILHAGLWFARQPDPDVEVTEEELTSAAPHASSPMPPPKPSKKRPILWILVLALLGAMAYVAMDPDMIIRALEPYLGETDPAAVPHSRSGPAAQTPAASAPAPASDASPSVAPVTPAPAMQNRPSEAISGGVSGVQGPLFAEGQKVSIVPDPAKPGAPVPIFADPAGTQPGGSVPPGAALTVLDGELLGSGWSYAVLTEDGRQGWVAEKYLKFRR